MTNATANRIGYCKDCGIGLSRIWRDHQGGTPVIRCQKCHLQWIASKGGQASARKHQADREELASLRLLKRRVDAALTPLAGAKIQMHTEVNS